MKAKEDFDKKLASCNDAISSEEVEAFNKFLAEKLALKRYLEEFLPRNDDRLSTKSVMSKSSVSSTKYDIMLAKLKYLKNENLKKELFKQMKEKYTKLGKSETPIKRKKKNRIKI